MEKIQKFLRIALVTQEKEDGYGRTRRRLNPLNPLSYVALISAVLITTFSYMRDMIKELYSDMNPFKWQ
jgi:hypothetical protein